MSINETKIKALVAKQADDEGCWFRAETAAEAYLQQQLRLLHAAIEGTDFFGLPLEDSDEARKAWCMKMAFLEGNAEIGAGALAIDPVEESGEQP